MHWQFTAYTLPAVFASAVAALLVALVWRRRDLEYAPAFALLGPSTRGCSLEALEQGALRGAA